MAAEKKDIDTQWVKTDRTTLLDSHKKAILHGNQLDDTIISFAQKLLKKQLMDFRIHCYKQRNRWMERNHDGCRWYIVIAITGSLPPLSMMTAQTG